MYYRRPIISSFIKRINEKTYNYKKIGHVKINLSTMTFTSKSFYINKIIPMINDEIKFIIMTNNNHSYESHILYKKDIFYRYKDDDVFLELLRQYDIQEYEFAKLQFS